MARYQKIEGDFIYTYKDGKLLSKVRKDKDKNTSSGRKADLNGSTNKPSTSSSTTTKPSTKQNKASDMRSKTAERTKGKVYQSGKGLVDKTYDSKTYDLSKKTENKGFLTDQYTTDLQVEAARKEANWQDYTNKVLNDVNYEQSEEGQAHLQRLENYDKSKPSGKVKQYEITDEDEKNASNTSLNRVRGAYNWLQRTEPNSKKTEKAKDDLVNALYGYSGEVSDNYKAMENEALEKAKKAITFEEQEYYESQAKAYRDRYNQYRVANQHEENVLKTDYLYANDKNTQNYIAIGKQNDTFLDKTDEDRKNTTSKALAGSVNEDDTLKAAAHQMTADEKNKYYYILGKNGQEAARSYVKALYDTGDLGERFAKKYSESIDKLEEEYGSFTRGAYDMGVGFMEGLTSFGESMQGIGLSWKEAVVGEVHYNELLSERLATKFVNEERAKTGNWGIDMSRSIGQMMPTIAVSVATGGAGAPAVVSQMAATGTTFGTVYGKTYIDTRRQGYDAKDSAAYSAAVAMLESGLQYGLNGVNAVSGGVATKGLSKAAGKAVSKLVSNPVANKVLNHVVTQAINSGGEFTEEYLQGVFDPILRNAFLNENNEVDIFDESNFLQGGIGALTAFIFNAPATVTGVKQYMTNAQKYGKAVNGTDLNAMVEQALSAPKTTDAYKTAKYITENYSKEDIQNGNVEETMKGVMLQEAAMNEQMQSDISNFINGHKSWNDLTDVQRATIVDPKNAQYISETFNVNVTEDMTPAQIKDVLSDTFRINRDINTSTSEIQEYINGTKTWKEISVSTKNTITNPKNADVLGKRTGININSDMTQYEILSTIDEAAKDIRTQNRIAEEGLTESEITQRNAQEMQELSLEENAIAERYENELELKAEKTQANKDLRDSVRELKKSIKTKNVETAKEWLSVVEEYQREAIKSDEEYLKTQHKNKDEKAKALRQARETHKKYADSMRKLLSREDGKTKTLENKLFKELKKLEANQKTETGFKYKQEALNILKELTSKKKAFKVKDFQKADAIMEAYENFKAEYPNLPPLQQHFENFMRETNKKTVSELNADELKTYYNLVKHLNHLQKTENRMIVHDKELEIKEMTASVIRDTESAPRHLGNEVSQVFTVRSLSPTTFLKTIEGHTGKSLSLLAEDINKGFVEQEKLKHEIYDELNTVIKDIPRKTLAKMFGNKAEIIDTGITVTNENGEAIDLKLTMGEKIALYMNTENADNLRHILGKQDVKEGEMDYDNSGGIIIPDRTFLKKGKRSKAESAGTTVKLTKDNIADFKKTMTAEEMQYVDMFKRVYDRCQKAINETSVKDVGYEIANIENYYPIKLGSKYIVGDFMFDTDIVTQDKAGMLKPRSEMSTKPIMLTDSLVTMFNHVNQVSSYYGLNMPLKNIKTIFNQDGVQESIKAQFGHSDVPVDYMQKFMQDLGITHKEITSLDVLRGNFAKAALGLNPSVAISQISAYPAAAIVVSNKSLVEGATMNCHTKSKIDLIRRYSPLYRTREAGNTDVDVAAISDVNKSKLKLKTNWIVRMDLFTVRQLWGACEMEVRHNSPELQVGTDAYYKEVGRLHTEVIQRTQVNTSTMQTNAFQRSNIGKMAFMFRSESFKNYNILFDAYSKLRAVYDRYKNGTATKEEMQQARKDVALATTSQIASAASFAGVKAIIGALMDSDYGDEDESEKEFAEKFGEKFMDKLIYNFINSFSGNFVGGSEAIAVTSKMTGFGFEHEAIQIPAIDNINNTVDAVMTLFNEVPKMINGESKPNDVYSAVKNFAKMFGNFIGVPVGSIEKYTTNAIGLFNPEFKAWYESLNYGTELQDIRYASERDAEYVAKEFLASTSPVVAETEAGKVIADLATKYRNDDNFSLGSVFIPNVTSITYNGEEIKLTTEQKHRVSDIANEQYSTYANKLVQSKAFKKLNDKDKFAALSLLVDEAVSYAKNSILNSLGNKVEYSKINTSYIPEYALYKVATKGNTKDIDNLNDLVKLDVSAGAKVKIYEQEFEKFTDYMNSAMQKGMTVGDTISAQYAMKYIDKNSNNAETDKLQWAIDNASSEKELVLMYEYFIQPKNTDYHKTIEFAEKQGVRPEAFVRREIELNNLSADKSYYASEDLMWKDGGLSTEIGTSSSSQANKQNKAELLVNGDYTEDEIVYFWQKEYPNDDDFPVAIAIGLSPTEYVKYYSQTKSNAKKADAILSLQSLNLSQPQQDIMMVFIDSSWKIPAERKRAVEKVVENADLPYDVKQDLANKLKI